jgi:glycosyltransferase involved in cell wall biosynthesis
MKKIGVIDYIGKKGGNHYYSICLLDEIAKKGWETFILSNFSENLGLKLPHLKTVYPFELKKNAAGLIKLINGTAEAALFFRQKKIKIVVFHLFNSSLITLFNLLIIRLFGLKVIGIAHDISGFDNKDKTASRNFIYKKLLNKIIVHNQYSYNFAKQNLPLEVESKLHIIKHGNHLKVINTSIEKEKAREILKLNKNETYALFFGQIKEVKGLDLLLEAFPNDSDNFNLIIAGKPWKEDFSKYEEIINRRQLKDKVSAIIRYISEEEKDLLYSAADFIVLPYKEIFQSGVLLMSMSYNRPVLASDLAANKEVINPETGLLFESENIIDLGSKLKFYAANKTVRDQHAKNARTMIGGEYSWSKIAEKYIRVAEEITSD